MKREDGLRVSASTLNYADAKARITEFLLPSMPQEQQDQLQHVLDLFDRIAIQEANTPGPFGYRMIEALRTTLAEQWEYPAPVQHTELMVLDRKADIIALTESYPKETMLNSLIELFIHAWNRGDDLVPYVMWGRPMYYRWSACGIQRVELLTHCAEKWFDAVQTAALEAGHWQ